MRHPSLRTVRAVLPHTALRLMVVNLRGFEPKTQDEVSIDLWCGGNVSLLTEESETVEPGAGRLGSGAYKDVNYVGGLVGVVLGKKATQTEIARLPPVIE